MKLMPPLAVAAEKTTLQFFRKTLQSHSLFRKTQYFQGFVHDCNQTVIGDNLKVHSLAVTLRRLLVGAVSG